MRALALLIMFAYYFSIAGLAFRGGRALLTGRLWLYGRHSRQWTLMEGPVARIVGIVYLVMAYFIHESFFGH